MSTTAGAPAAASASVTPLEQDGGSAPVEPDFADFETVSRSVMEVFREVTPLVYLLSALFVARYLYQSDGVSYTRVIR